MHKLLIAILLVFSTFTCYARSPDVCMNQADFVYSWTEVRDIGVSKVDLVASVSPMLTNNEIQTEILKVIDIIYDNPKLSPNQLADKWFDICVELPNLGQSVNK